MTGTTGQMQPRGPGREALGAGEEMAGAPLPPGRTTGAQEQHCGWPFTVSYPITRVAFFSPVIQFVDDPFHIHKGRIDQEKQGVLGLYGFVSQFQQLKKHSVGLTGWFTC